MSHSFDDPDDFARTLRELQNSVAGTYPEGRLNAADKGAGSVGVRALKGSVWVHFGAPLAAFGTGPEQAREIAQWLLDAAQECDGIRAVVRRVE